MRYSIIAAPIVLAASVSAGEYGTTWTTEVVSTLTTYCSSATSLSINGKIHTVTEATTLTVTDCPCTLTHHVIATSTTPVAVSSTPVAPIVTPAVSSTPVAPVVTPAVSSAPVVVVSSSTPVTPVVVANSSTPAVILNTAPAASVVPLSSVVAVAPYPVSNSTTLVPVATTPSGSASVAVAPSASVVSTLASIPAAKSTFKGAADRTAASSISLVALFALAAYLL